MYVIFKKGRFSQNIKTKQRTIIMKQKISFYFILKKCFSKSNYFFLMFLFLSHLLISPAWLESDPRMSFTFAFLTESLKFFVLAKLKRSNSIIDIPLHSLLELHLGQEISISSDFSDCSLHLLLVFVNQLHFLSLFVWHVHSPLSVKSKIKITSQSNQK